MENFNLTKSEIATLRIEHKLAKKSSAKLAYRINAIILLGSGWSIANVSDALLLDDATLRSYVKKFKDGGVKLLLSDNYNGRQSFLSDEQKIELTEHLENKLYRTSIEIIKYVNSNYKVKYSTRGMCNLLHDLGFTYKKPKLIPSGFNYAAQEEFIEYFNEFIKNKKDTESVVFYDSSHPQYQSTTDYGWIKKGKEMLLKNHGNRGRVNISGGVDIDTGQVIVDFPEKVNSETTIATLKNIELCYPKSEVIHVVLDNARVHKSKIVRKFLLTSKINLVFLPPYSPNLNIMERIWRLLRSKTLTNSFRETYTEFRNVIMKFFNNTIIEKNDDWIQPWIEANFQEFEGNVII